MININNSSYYNSYYIIKNKLIKLLYYNNR